MDKYIINGTEIEFDTFDVSCMERYENGFLAVDAQLRRDEPDETGVGKLRRGCNAVMDFFDDVVGDGTATKIFGNRTNVKECIGAYNSFIGAVSVKMRDFKADMEVSSANLMPANRQQRRAAERK